MISYEPFYNTLQKKEMTEYALIFHHGISPNTLQRMRHQEAITTTTLDTFCEILDCAVSDIIKYVPPDEV